MKNAPDPRWCPTCGERTDRPYLACSTCSDRRRADARAAKDALPANMSRIEEHRERARRRAALSREPSWSPRFVTAGTDRRASVDR